MAAYKGPIVDVDIHHRWKNESDIYSFLPHRWRQYAQDSGVSIPVRPPNGTIVTMMENAARLANSFPPDGTAPGSDYEVLKEQLLDKYGYWRGILTHDLGEYGQHLNTQFGIELCRAANDWNIACWLPLDDRLYSLVAVPAAVPEAAADEIRRVGDNPKLAGVLLAGNGLGRPLGDLVYDPIYKAAAEMGLEISVHLAVNRPNFNTTAAGGQPTTGIVAASQFGQEAMHYVTSLITEGVFERYPNLRVMFKEFGTAWAPSIIWGMDKQYEQLKLESAWVKRWPSEYFHDHIKLSTQPFEESPNARDMMTVMAAVDGMEDILCFSSDYPHLTFDDPTWVARRVPPDWAQRVMYKNACDFYGWTYPSLDGAGIGDRPTAADRFVSAKAGA
jgi:hypothetical protein